MKMPVYVVIIKERFGVHYAHEAFVNKDDAGKEVTHLNKQSGITAWREEITLNYSAYKEFDETEKRAETPR